LLAITRTFLRLRGESLGEALAGPLVRDDHQRLAARVSSSDEERQEAHSRERASGSQGLLGGRWVALVSVGLRSGQQRERVRSPSRRGNGRCLHSASGSWPLLCWA
jgi:hypothetical protein